jgi:O-antigen/teichoic acid export membrane protein
VGFGRWIGRGGKDGAGHRGSYREALGFGALTVVANVLLGLVSSVLVARVYGIEVVGGFALAAAPTLAMFYLSSLREQQGMVRELAVLTPRGPGVTGILAAVLSFSVALSVVVAVPVSFVAHLLYNGPIGRPDLFGPALFLMGAYILLQNTSWNLEMLLSAFRAGRELFRVRFLQSASYLVCAVAAGLLIDRSLWTLCFAIVTSYAVSAAGNVINMRGFVHAHVSREELRHGFRTLPRMIAYGAKITPGTIGYGVSNDAATWILGAVAPLSAVGAYSRSWMLVQRLRDVNLRISESLFPTLVERYSSGDRSGFDRAIIDTGRMVSILMLLPAAAAGGAAVGIMKVFGPGFDQGADAFAILMVLPAVGGIAQAMSHALNAVNRPLVVSRRGGHGGTHVPTGHRDGRHRGRAGLRARLRRHHRGDVPGRPQAPVRQGDRAVAGPLHDRAAAGLRRRVRRRPDGRPLHPVAGRDDRGSGGRIGGLRRAAADGRWHRAAGPGPDLRPARDAAGQGAPPGLMCGRRDVTADHGGAQPVRWSAEG